jgi:hypothetical protein
MATSAHPRLSWTPAGREAVVAAAYVTGGLMLAGEAAVHVQQYVEILHAVHWIGPLFLANAAACVAVIAALAVARARPAAALAGVGVSAVALASLVVSYGQGLFGWQEGGFRTPVELAVITELGAVILLSAALAGELTLPRRP